MFLTKKAIPRRALLKSAQATLARPVPRLGFVLDDVRGIVQSAPFQMRRTEATAVASK